MDRPVSITDIAGIASRLIGAEISVQPMQANRAAPPEPAGDAASQMPSDVSAMLDWFETGRYVADTTRQGEVFGPVPTAEDAIAGLATRLGHAVSG